MSQRLRLYDIRVSRLPSLVGLCAEDIPGLAGFTNTSQRRLVYAKEAGEEGWYGTWAEMAFNVSHASPYITCPRGVARIEAIVVCNQTIPINNQFYEYLQFGNGRMPRRHTGRLTEAYQRNNAVTFVDMAPASQNIVAYPTDSADVVKRVFIQGIDVNGKSVYSQDGTHRVEGIFLTLSAPFVSTPMAFNTLTGIQKDITAGPVQFFQSDPITGVQKLLLTMEAGETTAWYRRYYLDRLHPQTTQVTALAKLELVPVAVDTDYCLIQNLEAILEESQAIRLSEIDSLTAKQQAGERHMQAIRLLNGELTHYMGKDSPAVSVAPFGTARLEHQHIGTMI